METGADEAQKDCPSCGSRIAEAATRCDFCKSTIGRCVGCGAWIVDGTQCLDCGKSTARRLKKDVGKVSEEKAVPVAFRGKGVGLFVPLVLRQLLVLAWLGSVVLALAESGVTPVANFIGKHGVHLPANMKGWELWAFSAILLLPVMVASRIVRGYRARNTHLFGQPLDYHPSIAAAIGNTILALVVLAMTAGLGVPWIYARQVRTFHRSCKVASRGGKALEWDGAGEAVLGRFFLMLLLLPVAVATAGFGGIVISWMWISWEQKHLLAPDRNGILQRVRFTGTFGGYFARALPGWLLTLVTAGLYWPWAKVGDWEWIAAHTEAA
jgi:hypothetical protein